MKSKRQAQMLLFERERRKRLETELEVCRSKENLLKSEIERLDTALHKVLLNLLIRMCSKEDENRHNKVS